MNGINRLLTSRREKDKSEKNSQQRSKSTEGIRKSRPKSADSILALFRYPYTYDEKKVDKEEAKKIHRILQRLRESKYENFDEAQVEFGLRTEYAAGNEDRAFDILVLFRQSIDGIVKPYDQNIKMLGAANVNGVTCYLDSLLFAMFARLENFQPMLYTVFEDEPRRRLSALIRIWVNMLRTGKLIHGDITKLLQEALVACGWKEACTKRQQDTSEAFSFITEQLHLPLLTLKTDLFHVGAEDKTGDHKFVNERLLDVAIPPDREDGRPIKLEDCLEEYLNTRVEVRRHLERSNTMSSMSTRRSQSEKSSQLLRLRVSELTESGPTTPTTPQECNSPVLSLPPPTPTVVDTPVETTSLSQQGHERRPSIVKRYSFEGTATEVDTETQSGWSPLQRKNSRTRKEIQLPAWQITSLIPFFIANKPMSPPTTDAQVAYHFSSDRPVLGICLKRYAVKEDGNTMRRDTFVEIPLQIALPHFIQQEDDEMFENFKICLQSVVCHRGNSVHSGHYITLIRGSRLPENDDHTLQRQMSNSSPPKYSADPWFKFDDLAAERVTPVDIHQALKDETPYLLFFRIQPLFDEALSDIAEEKPPSYTCSDSGIEMAVQEASPREEGTQEPGYFDGTAQLTPTPNRVSFSDDAVDQNRRSLNLPDTATAYSRRGSIAVTETSLGGSRAASFIASATTTPGEENPTTVRVSRKSDEENGTASRLSRVANTFRSQHSRSASAAGDNRLSFSNFIRKKSKDELKQPNEKPGSINTLTTDGTIENPIDEPLIADSGELSRKRSKKGKGKEKTKSSPEKNKGWGGNGRSGDKEGNERECMIM